MESSVVIKPVHLIFFQRRAYSNYLPMLRWFICFSKCEKMHKLNDTLIICVMISSMVFESVQSVVLEFFAPRCCRSHDYNTTRSDKATDSFFTNFEKILEIRVREQSILFRDDIPEYSISIQSCKTCMSANMCLVIRVEANFIVCPDP